MLKDKKIDVEEVRVLDPACGSGSFLIKAFDLLNEYYKESCGDYKQTQLDLESGIPFKTKSRILQNNIFGVDLDKQAVEIAQLNLLLKIAEKGHRLPLLERNIKTGNSLIDDENIAGVKAFHWEKEFNETISSGGFDVIIGNPPYVRPHNILPRDKEYLWKNLVTFKAKSDLYNCFMEKSITLLKQGGFFSFIVPHTWISLESFYDIRKFVLENCRVMKLVQLPKKVFQEATVETTIFVLVKESNKQRRNENSITVEALDEKGNLTFVKRFTQEHIWSNHLLNFELYLEKKAENLFEKIRSNNDILKNQVIFFYGLKTGDDRKFLSRSERNSDYRKLLLSKDIDRYSVKFNENYVWYVPDMMVKNKITARPGDKERFESEKIIIARMGKNVVATYDNEKYYVKDAMLLLKKTEQTNLKYLTGLLNSKLINYYYKNYFITIDVLKNAILELPIAVADKTVKREICEKVTKILELSKKINDFGDKVTDERVKIGEEAKRTDDEIDELVYKIYGISESEKEIVENGLK